MSTLDFVVLLIVAAICGVIGKMLAGYTTGGCITSTLVGFVGAVIGTWIASSFGVPKLFAINLAGQAFPIAWSVMGSALFVAILALLTRGRVTI